MTETSSEPALPFDDRATRHDDPRPVALLDSALPRTSGQPVRAEDRAALEPTLGADLSGVRLHDDADSAAVAGSAGAVALTSGRDVYFARGAYAPDDPAGRRLLAHELAHTVQQRDVAGAGPAALPVDADHDPLEREAESLAARATGDRNPSPTPAGIVGRAAAPVVQRQKAPGAAESPVLSRHLPWDGVTLAGFAERSAEPTSEHRDLLRGLARDVAAMAGTYPDTFLSLVGHADAAEGGRDLAAQRAEAVRSLLESLGVPARMLSASGSPREAGSGPGATGRGASGRRVEIQVVKRNFVAEHRPASPAQGVPSGETRPPTDPPTAGPMVLPTPVTRFLATEMHRLGLPEALRGRLVELSRKGIEGGIGAALAALAQDRGIDERYRDAVRAVLRGVVKLR